MKTNDNQYYIYIRSTHERIPVTQQQFNDYYRDINAFRKKQQRHGRCACPEYKRLECDMNCVTCQSQRAGDSLSLDYTTVDDEGNEQAWIDTLADRSPLMDEIIADSQQLEQLFIRLKELVPEAIQIGKLRLEGYTDIDIAKRIGIRNTTFRSRLERAKKILSEEFPEFF